MTYVTVFILVVAAFATAIAAVAAWVTHVIWWVNLVIANELDTLGEAVLAIIGTIAPPIGVIHGLIIWF